MQSPDAQKLLDLGAPDLQNAVRILVAHEQAICQGDEDAADELLADLEPLLRRLNWAQNEWLRGLSGDLHMLNNEETFIKNPYSPQEYEALLVENWNGIQNDPSAFLRLLRFEQDELPLARMAYVRGRAYGILGFLNVATVFTRMASNLDPQQPFYRMALIATLNDQKMFEELDGELTEILASPITDPDLVVNAVAISFSRAVKASVDLERPYLGELRRRLQQIFNRNSMRVLRPGTALLGLHTLGTIQDRLHRPVKAQECYQQALQVDPQNQAVRISLALSLLQNDEIKAYQMFDEVAKEGTNFEIAYLLAAKHAGEQGLFGYSSAMAEKAIAVTGNMTLRAYAYEVLGINEAETNGPTNKAYGYFSEALRLAPHNINIQANYDAFQASLNETQLEVSERPRLNHHLNQWVLWDAKLIDSLKFNHQAGKDNTRKDPLDWYEEGSLPLQNVLSQPPMLRLA